MRFGTAGRIAVLASLALLMSGQLCMLTTCLPRLRASRDASAAHACCRGPEAARSVPDSPGAGHDMPCNLSLMSVSAPVLDGATPSQLPAALSADVTVSLAPPLGVSIPASTAGAGPPPNPPRSAPSGLRAPPQA